MFEFRCLLKTSFSYSLEDVAFLSDDFLLFIGKAVLYRLETSGGFNSTVKEANSSSTSLTT